MKALSKKQQQNIMGSRGSSGQANFPPNHFSHREPDMLVNQAFFEQGTHQERQESDDKFDQDDSDSEDITRKQGSDEDERDRERFMMNKTPSQDMFYKNGGIQSHDSLKRSKHRSEERTAAKIVGQGNQSKQQHSQSMNSTNDQADQPNGNDSQAAMPPAFDKKILQQHRNSADSEFNNKGHRKLRPAQKSSNGQASGNVLANDKSKNKMLLTECLIDDRAQDQQSSNSLDEIEFHRTVHEGNERNNTTNNTNRHKADDVNAVAPGTAGHRRAKSSIGMNRKASGKHNKESSGSSKLPPGPMT